MDAETITLFRHLGDRPLPIAAPAVILALVVVQSGFEKPPGMSGLLRNVERLTVSDRLTVGPLPTEDGCALLAEQWGEAGVAADPSVVRAIAEDVGGNPRALVEYARYLRDRASLAVEAVGVEAMGVPPSLCAAIEEHLDRVPPEVAALVQTAAVIGPTVSVATVAIAGDLSEDEALYGLERAVAARLLDEDPDRPEGYRFCSALQWRVCLDRLSSARRSRVEARLRGTT